MTISNQDSFRTVVGACPLDCPDACSWRITVDSEDRAVKIRGNPDHPFTAGGLCQKVNPWLENATDNGRLLTPLRRVGQKGKGSFEPTSWDDAIAWMASEFKAVIARSGPAAIWPFHGTGNLGWLQGTNGPHRIWNKMGASAHHMSICSAAGREGINYSVGSGDWLDAESFSDAGLIIIWASNTLVTNRHLWPFVEKARKNGAKLVVVDPLRTRTAERADQHLSIRPGTDGALALGLCRALVEEGGADEAFLADRTVGSAAFLAELSAWDLQRTEDVTGVTASQIEGLTAGIIAAPPLAIRIGHGVQRHATGGQAMRLVSCVPAIVGAYDQVGGGSLYSSSGTPKGYNLEKARRPELGERPRTLTMTNLGRNLTELDDPPVEALVIYGANPLVSNPGSNLVRRGLEREDLFTVVIDIYETETTEYADLVLPSTMQHEQTEIIDSYNHRFINWNEAAVPPAGSCLPHTEIFRRLATAMGYTEPELQASDLELAADTLDTSAFREAGITVDTLRAEGFRPLPERAAPSVRLFLTPSGKFEFASELAEQEGHGLLPNYRPPAEAAGASFALIAPASEFHVNSTFAGTKRIRDRAEAPPLTVHPEDATALGLKAGDLVSVGNERGRFEATVAISDRSPRGVVSMTKGWWGQGVNNTVAERDADMGGGAIFHDNAVRITAVDPDRS